MPDQAFVDALTNVYRENPCQALPNSLSKIVAELDKFQTAIGMSQGVVNRLEAYRDNSLFIYWTRQERQPGFIIRRRLSYMDAAYIHQDYLDPDTVAGFSVRQPFFRLIHRHQVFMPAPLPDDLRFVQANPTREAALIADFINLPDAPPEVTIDAVENWPARPVFAPDLCLWVLDSQTDQPLGFGLAELDTTLGEAWIERLAVKADQHGLERLIAAELVQRVQGRAAFTTLSGPVEDRDNPGGLYRQCGFTGSDVWWFLTDSIRT